MLFVPKAHLLATVWLKDREGPGAEGKGVLTGGEVMSGGVDMSPKSSNWVTACKEKKTICSVGHYNTSRS